jgi:hypothetical protein
MAELGGFGTTRSDELEMDLGVGEDRTSPVARRATMLMRQATLILADFSLVR